jgi:hypothetical protein
LQTVIRFCLFPPNTTILAGRLGLLALILNLSRRAISSIISYRLAEPQSISK